MADESVKILIDAEDKASAKLRNLSKEMDENVKHIKTVGGSAKASTEIVGTLASQLGASGIGGFAGELAQLTERVSAFAEVSKAGGAGALAFKAGLAAAVGVLAFKVGSAIGNAIFQTEKLNREFERTQEISRELANSFASVQDMRFSEQVADLREIASLEERRRVAQEQANTMMNSQADRAAKIKKLTEDITWRSETWAGWTASIWGEYSKTTDILRDQLAVAEENSAQAEKQKLILLDIAIGERDRAAAAKQAQAAEQAKAESSKSYVATLRSELELLKATKSERLAIEAARGTANAADEKQALMLLKERDAIQAKAAAEKQAEAEREKSRSKQLAFHQQQAREAAKELAAKQGVIEAIRKQALETAIGKRAAEAYALQQKGFDKRTANRLAGIMAAQGGPGTTSKQSTGSTSLSATESRLLTRGRGADRQRNIESNTKMAAEAARDQLVMLERIAEVIASQSGIELRRGDAA